MEWPKHFSFKSKKAIILASFALVSGYAAYKYRNRHSKQSRQQDSNQVSSIRHGQKSQKVAVDKVFFKRLLVLIRVVIPKPLSREVLQLIALTVFLWLRTALTLKIADMTGMNAEALVLRDSSRFFRGVVTLGLLAIPASIVNSAIKYTSAMLQLNIRQRLSRHIHQLYLNGMSFYRASNVGSHLDNIDQRITQDIDKFSTSLSSLYGTIFKPVLDIILLTGRLASVVGLRGPLMMYLYYFISSILLRAIMPPFAKLTAEQQKLEGDFRYVHSRLINYSEEIAFYSGNKKEKNFMNRVFDKLYNHSKGIFQKQASLGVFDSWLVKYGATMIGYAVVAVPVFGSFGMRMYGSGNSDSAKSAITRDYVRNSSILINLARAIGQIILLYKNFTQLAGYTSRVAELREVLLNCVEKSEKEEGNGTYEESDYIEFRDISIVSPDKVTLVKHLNFKVEKGMNLLIVGPNGCGKSSVFRVLSGLWPLEEGHIIRPKPQDMFYIPQKPYLTVGTLRQQIIYPHSEEQMKERGITDDDLLNLMNQVEMRYLVEREGWDKEQDWAETLSQGEQQRAAMARLFYHSPKYAILDECTSQLSLDVEAFLYNHCNELEISLITVAHRKSLWKYHSHILLFDGTGGYQFRELESHEMVEDENQGFNK